MTLRAVRLTSLADELDLILPPRDKQEMPVKVPSREIIAQHLNPPSVVPYRRRRK